MSVNFLFPWLNLAIFAWLGLWLYRRYGQAQLLTAQRARIMARQNLQFEVSNLENWVREAVIDQLVQKQQAAVLLKRVEQWQLAVASQNNSLQTELTKRQYLLNQQGQLRSESLAQHLEQRDQWAMVVDQTTQLVQKACQNPAVAQNFLDNALQRLGMRDAR